jgi:hypothetical protein
VNSGLAFPFTTDQNYGFTQHRPVIVYRFGTLDAKQEQRYGAGIGPRKFAFRRQHLSKRDRNTLASFREGLQGAWQAFTYKVPNADQTITPTLVTWEYAPLSIQYLANAWQLEVSGIPRRLEIDHNYIELAKMNRRRPRVFSFGIRALALSFHRCRAPLGESHLAPAPWDSFPYQILRT